MKPGDENMDRLVTVYTNNFSKNQLVSQKQIFTSRNTNLIKQKIIMHDQQFQDPTATVNQMQTQSSIFNKTIEAVPMFTALNHNQQQAGNQEVTVKFTPSKLLEINSSQDERDQINKILDYHQRQDTTRQEITQYLLQDKLIRNSPTNINGKPQMTLLQEYKLKLKGQENVTNESFSYLHENEISKETNQNDGPNINSSQTKQKIKTKHQNQLEAYVNVQDFQEQFQDDSYSEKMKNNVIRSFNQLSSMQRSPQKSPSPREDPMFILHRNYINPSDCSSILNESTNLKDMMMNRNNQKRLLVGKQEVKVKDSSLNLDSIPSQQTMTMSSPISTKINMILELNLRLANLKELSEALFIQNMFIRAIDVRNNRLTTIPDSICDLPHLWKIRIDYNYLTGLPKLIGFLPRLEFFSASQNKILELPQSFVQVGSKLGVFQINDNLIRVLPKDLGRLTELRSLLLHNNQLWEIPTSIYRMCKLNELSLDWFGYHFRDRQIPKIQKDETGKLIINETISFLQAFEKMQSCQLPRTCVQVSFMHYIMYFHKLNRATDLLELEFPKKRSIFHMLALNGNQYIFHELYTLLSNITKVDINTLDEEESTPLLLAIKNKRKDFVKYLVKQPSVNINKGSFKYGYPLHMLILTHDLKLAMKFISQESFSDNYKYLDINVKNEEGNNAMHFLFMNFSINTNQSKVLADALIKKGINLNAFNKNDFSPIHLAILGSNYEALEYALDYNKRMRIDALKNIKIPSLVQKPMFDFNQRGGKYSQNCLHLAVTSSNIRTVMILLQSEEHLNYYDTDDEGRLPKDICPYNSPFYKLLIQYEKIQTLKQNEKEMQFEMLCLDLSQQEVAHFNMSRRVCESPKTTRKRMIDRAKNNSLNLYSGKRLRTHQSQNNIGFANYKQSQNSNTNYDYLEEDEGEVTHHKTFSLDRQGVVTQSHHRILSGTGINTAPGKTHLVLSSMNDDSNYGVDEFSNMDLQTANNKKSPALMAQNLHRNILTKHKAKPQVSQQININTNSNNKECIIFRKKRQSQCGQNPVVISSNISSPNDSYLITNNNAKPAHSKNISDISREQFILQQPFRLEKNESIIDKSPCNVSRINKQQSPYQFDPNYADAEEDEANIPEEDINRSSDNHTEAKSPIRVIQKAQTASGNQSSIQINQQKLMLQVKRIMDEVNKCQIFQEQTSENGRWKINLSNQYNRQSNLSQNNNNSQQKQSMVTVNQEQGNGVNEISSQLCIVTDDFNGIQSPQEEQFSPKFQHNQKEFNNFKSKLNYDLFKDNQIVFSDKKVLLPYNKVNYLASYQVMFQAFVNNSCNFKQVIMDSLQTFQFLNPNDNKIIIDAIFIALTQMNNKDIQEIFFLLLKIRVLRLSYQNVNRGYLDFILFELFNAYQIKTYEAQKQYQCKIVQDIFDQHHMETDSHPYQAESIQKLRHFHKSPSFKAMTYKSPSNSINFMKESWLSRQQSPKMHKIKDFSSTQNLFNGTNSNDLKNFINISSMTSNFQNSRKMSSEGYRENLSRQIAQPLQSKVNRTEVKTSQTNNQMLNTERLQTQQRDTNARPSVIVFQQSNFSKKASISNEQEPYQPKLSGSLFLQSIEIQSKKLKDQVHQNLGGDGTTNHSKNSTHHQIMKLDKTEDSQLYYYKKQTKPSSKIYQKTKREKISNNNNEDYEVFGNVVTENLSQKNPNTNTQSIQSSRMIQHFEEEIQTFINSRNEVQIFDDNKNPLEQRFYQSQNPIQTLRSFEVKQSAPIGPEMRDLNNYSPDLLRKDFKNASGRMVNRHLLNTNSTIQGKISTELTASSRSSALKKPSSSRQNLFPGKIQIPSSSKQKTNATEKNMTLSKTDKTKISFKQSPIKSAEKTMSLYTTTQNSINKASARKLHPYKPSKILTNQEAKFSVREFSPQTSHRVTSDKINKTCESDKKIKISMSLKKF